MKNSKASELIMKPFIHAESSAKKFGGKPEDYLPIHDLMDSSKGVIADHRHRALTHNTWFIMLLEKIFGSTITNSNGQKVSVRDVGEQHVLEDFRGKFIPSAQDWLNHLQYVDWMNNGAGTLGSPPQNPQPPVMPIIPTPSFPYPQVPTYDDATTPTYPFNDRLID